MVLPNIGHGGTPWQPQDRVATRPSLRKKGPAVDVETLRRSRRRPGTARRAATPAPPVP